LVKRKDKPQSPPPPPKGGGLMTQDDEIEINFKEDENGKNKN